MRELPAGWAETVLGQVVTHIEAGKSFKCEERPAARGEWGVIKVSAMTWGSFREEENKVVPISHPVDLTLEIRPGDLLLSRANTSSYVGATVLVKSCRPHLLLSDKSMRLNVHDTIDRSWLHLALSSPLLRRQMTDLATGTSDSMRNISQDKVKALRLYVPPAAEQRRIVAAVDEHFSRLDAAEASLRRAQQNFRRLHPAVLRRAISDVAWQQLPLRDFSDVFVGATPQRTKEEYWSGNIWWVSSGEVAFCRIRETRETISHDALRGSARRLHPPGTVMLAMIGEGKTRGQAAILDVAAAHSQNSAAIRLDPTSATPEWLFYFLMSRYEATRKSSAGNNQPALNKSRVESILVPLPPLELQRRIVTEVEQELSVVDAMAASVERALKRSARLRQAVLQQAFTGRLVPQDPTDEPASVLLDGIARERAQQPEARRRRSRPATLFG